MPTTPWRYIASLRNRWDEHEEATVPCWSNAFFIGHRGNEMTKSTILSFTWKTLWPREKFAVTSGRIAPVTSFVKN